MFWVKSPTGEVVDQKLAIDELPGDVDYEIAKSYAFVMMEEFDKVKEQSLDKRSPNDIISVETLQKKVLTRITSRFQRRYAKYRPGYARGQIETVWETAKAAAGGNVYDPSSETINWDRRKKRNGQWDMGHIKGQKYSTKHKQYMLGMMTDEEFKVWYQNPANYRPELPRTNRSHKYE